VIVCKLLGLKQVPRASGADILEHLCERSTTEFGRPLRVFFFGGATGVAEAARNRMNDLRSGAVLCVGAIDPGFGTVEELSRPEWIHAINDANPDILILALGAERGQAWLLHNAERLTVPVRTHFGAAVNFLAGKVQRAPANIQRFGLEWLWRIAQEPLLARRYLFDGVNLMRLTLGNILPLAALLASDRLLRGKQSNRLVVNVRASDNQLSIFLSGCAGASTMATLHAVFDKAVAAGTAVTLDLGGLVAIDLDGFGAMMRLRRDLENRGLSLRLEHARPRILRRMKFAGAGWMA
jgi:N-acetylglucosaminyldiphosphoundecaprenol N-acetyl-beta-D-mannosaminyltransferase